jgi:hypothetical protein
VADATDAAGLRVVDGAALPDRYREALRPGDLVEAGAGRMVQLPRFFFEIESWEAALETRLSPHFHAFEFLDTDLREAEPLSDFPRYLPCAVVAFAAAMDRFRDAVGGPVRIAANGGYRSPAHALSVDTSPHLWGAAADIYRIGDDSMDDLDRIDRYARVAREAVAGVWVRPTGDVPGRSFDHLHLDLGYLTLVPRPEHMEEPQ